VQGLPEVAQNFVQVSQASEIFNGDVTFRIPLCSLQNLVQDREITRQALDILAKLSILTICPGSVRTSYFVIRVMVERNEIKVKPTAYLRLSLG